MPSLPYLATPGTVDSGFEKIRSASEPQELTTTNVGEMIGLKGGTGADFVRLLKKLGFVADGGRPTELYRRYRGEKGPSTALADGIRTAYANIFQRNENAHAMPRDELAALIVEITGAASDSRVVDFTVATFQRLVKLANFSGGRVESAKPKAEEDTAGSRSEPARQLGAGSILLAHNIHLNLPDTTDIRVFDAIFRSLRENLLK